MGDFGWLHFSDLHLSGCTLDAEMAKDKLIDGYSLTYRKGNLEQRNHFENP